MEYADDAVLPDKDTQTATQRLTTLDAKAQQEAGMKISIAKTKAQHIRSRPTVSDTTESDITNLPLIPNTVWSISKYTKAAGAKADPQPKF